MIQTLKRVFITIVLVAGVAAGIIYMVIMFMNGAPNTVTNALSEKTGDKIVANKHPSEILEMLDSGKISDDMLENMYFSEQEFRRIMKKVDESEKLVTNQITYEYYAEEWDCIDTDDETGEEIWGWRKGYKKKTIEITNERIEKPHKVDWQTVYILAVMASLYESDQWKNSDVVQERINDKVLNDVIRVLNYEYNYIWDGARAEKKFYKWDELESICYRYSETGDWDVDEWPVGEYHIRTCEKTPTSCASTILNAPEMFEFEFQKNTQCTPRYQKPNNWEVAYMIYNRDIDIFTRASQIVSPIFRWDWFLSMLGEMPGVDDLVDEETGEPIDGILTRYQKYREEFKAHKSYTKEDHDVEDKGIIVGEELTYIVDNRENILKNGGHVTSIPVNSSESDEDKAYLGSNESWWEEYSSKYSASVGTMFPPINPDTGQFTSGFGHRTPPTKGATSFHKGIDIAAPSGTPVYSAVDGIVTVVQEGHPKCGKWVEVQSSSDPSVKTRYMHLSDISVQKGQKVTAGMVLGKVGRTGVATGNHLHFAVAIDGELEDPREWLAAKY